jgi:hypothetical protein
VTNVSGIDAQLYYFGTTSSQPTFSGVFSQSEPGCVQTYKIEEIVGGIAQTARPELFSIDVNTGAVTIDGTYDPYDQTVVTMRVTCTDSASGDSDFFDFTVELRYECKDAAITVGVFTPETLTKDLWSPAGATSFTATTYVLPTLNGTVCEIEYELSFVSGPTGDFAGLVALDVANLELDLLQNTETTVLGATTVALSATLKSGDKVFDSVSYTNFALTIVNPCETL